MRAIPVLRNDLSRIKDGYGIEAFGLGFEELTRAISGSEITGLELKTEDSDWTALAIMLLERVPELEVDALLEFTNFVIKSLKNPPSKHLVFEDPELDRQEPDKLVVGKPRVDKQVLD
nr:hypothetical protein [Tanacetum cinerariifolium]